VKRLALVVRLREGAAGEAEGLLAGGPPFDPADTGLERHSVYLTKDEVIFVFEGTDIEWEIDDLASDFLRPGVRVALDRWRHLVSGPPRIAREVFSWERESR
jgi:hypothetical protein